MCAPAGHCHECLETTATRTIQQALDILEQRSRTCAASSYEPDLGGRHCAHGSPSGAQRAHWIIGVPSWA
jgi:hypothetical protein